MKGVWPDSHADSLFFSLYFRQRRGEKRERRSNAQTQPQVKGHHGLASSVTLTFQFFTQECRNVVLSEL